MRSRELVIAIAAASAGVALRALAVTQDLWLDEIRSLQDASALSSPFEAFRLAIDNNHILITLLMHALGVLENPVAYRIPSLLAGVASIAFAYHIGRRRSAHCAFVYPVLFAVCFPLIVYSSEARGYSLAVAFALACYALYEDAGEPGIARMAALWTCIVCGLLAHLTFIYVYGALACWSLVRCARSGIGLQRSAIVLFELHIVPCLALVALYVLMVGHLRTWGGADWRYADVLAESLGWALGAPASFGLVPLAVAAGLLLAWDTRERWRAGSDSFVFFPVAIVVLPFLVLVTRGTSVLAPRYFIVNIAFLLLPWSAAIAQWMHRRRALGTVALALVVAGNLVPAIRFIELGRGQYSAALSYIASHTPGREITIGSDHDVRNGRMLAYYALWLRSGQSVRYVLHADRDPNAPHWLILHSFDQPPAPRQALVVKSGAAYRLRKTFPYWGPSGFHWFVYEHVASTAVPPT